MKFTLVFILVILSVCSLSIAKDLPICGVWEQYQCKPIPKNGCPDGGQVKDEVSGGDFPHCCPKWCPVMCGGKGKMQECNFDQKCIKGERFYLKGTPGAVWPKCCSRCSNNRFDNLPDHPCNL